MGELPPSIPVVGFYSWWKHPLWLVAARLYILVGPTHTQENYMIDLAACDACAVGHVHGRDAFLRVWGGAEKNY